MPEAPPPYRPSVLEVASYIRARTKIDGGAIAGTFNDLTKVKPPEVESIIEQAVGLILSDLGGVPCTEKLQESMKSVAAILAAMLVEQSLFPEQTTGAGNSFASLEKLYKPKMKSLAEQVEKQCGTGGGGEGGGDDAGSAISRATFDSRRLLGPNGPTW
jgi:hypothetical protein